MKLALALVVVFVASVSPPGQQGQPPSRSMGVEILSDTQGVDFSDYLIKVISTLRHNWEHAMPESTRKGDKGVVYITFQINPDGSVPASDPILERTSGQKTLDDAAMAAVRASTPFAHLPSQFHGTYLRLRLGFIYGEKGSKYKPIIALAPD